jgi:hypothetical protein
MVQERWNVSNVTKGLTTQFLGQLSVLFIIILVCSSGVLKAEFTGPNFIQPIHHRVFEVFNLVFKGGDLCSEPASSDLQVFDCLSQHVDFDLTSNSGSPFLV